VEVVGYLSKHSNNIYQEIEKDCKGILPCSSRSLQNAIFIAKIL